MSYFSKLKNHRKSRRQDGRRSMVDIVVGARGFLTVLFCFAVSSIAQAATTFTLDQGTLITGGLRLCDSSGNYCVNITEDGASGEPAIFTTAPRIFQNGSTGEGNGVQADELVILNYDTSTSPIPFNLNTLNISDVDSLTDGSNATQVRDAYSWSAGGTWATDKGAIVSINTANADNVGSFVISDPDGDNNLNEIGQFTILPAGASDVMLNMQGTPNNHNTTFTLDTPSTTISMYIFNSGGGNMAYFFTPTMTVTLPDPILTLNKTVDNSAGGSAVASDFTLSFTDGGTNSGSGVSGSAAITNVAVAAGTYTLSETNVASYIESLSCVGVLDTNPNDGLTLGDGDAATCTFTNTFSNVPPPAPSLTNVKAAPTLKTDADGSTDITAGDTLEYVVTVTNTGNVVLNNVVVSDSQLSPSSNTCSTVAVGATCVLTGDHIVSQTEANAGTLANTASVTSTEVAGPTPSNTVNTTVEQDTSLTNVKAAPTLKTDADGSTDITAGDTLEYVVTVTNTGNVTLNNVVVTDSQLTPNSNTCPTVAPSATCVLTGDHVVSQTEANAGTLANTASVTSTEVAGPTPSNTVNTTVNQDPSLTNVKADPTLKTDADGSTDITAGDTLEYVVTVTNTGNITLNNVVVTDSQLTPNSNTCATVAPGATCVLTGDHLVSQTEANAGTLANTASVTSTEIAGPTPSNTVNTTVNQDPALTNVKANPTLKTDADGSTDITAGDTLEYVVTVTNTGNVTLNNVVVSDTQLTPNSNSCAAVAVGATCVLTGDHIVSQTEANAGTLANTASVTSTEVAGPTPSNTVNTTVEQDPGLTNVKANPTLKTDADGSTDITAGDTLEYVVTMTNTGNVTLNNVIVSDTQLTPNSNTCTTVAPGATCVLTGDHVVSQTEANAGTLANTASVTSTEVAGPTPSNTVNTSVNQDPALTNVKADPTLKTDADGSTDITAGDTLEYVVTVTNTGNVTLNNVVVSDSQLTPNSNTCTTVAPGATCVLTGDHLVSLTEANAGTLANTASVTSTEVSGPTPSNTVNTSVNQDPALANVKASPTLKTDADGSTDITAGDTLEYVVTVTNTGNVTLNNVVVSDTQLTPNSNTCTTVDPGATCVLTGDHLVSQTEANAGTLANTASVTSTEVAGPTPSNTVNTTVNQDPALTNVKADPTLKTDADGSTDITAGDTLEYVVTVTNTGNVTLNNVVVSDAELTPNSNTCATVAPGATCALTGDHIVSQTEANTGTITNTASVTSTEVAGPTPSNTVNTSVNQDPGLTNIKSNPTLKTDADGSTDITAGDTLQYIIIVTNSGNITLNNVVVSDTQLTPSSETCATVAPGAACVLTGDHIVSQTEADAGSLANTASVTSTEVAGPTPSNTVNTTVNQDPSLTNVKAAPTLKTDADGSTDITAGDTLEYVVTVTNTGNITLNNVVVSDTQLTPASNTCTMLAPGATCVLTGDHMVSQSEANAGTIANTASVTSTELAGPSPSNTVNTMIDQDPSLTNVKAAPTLKTDSDGSTDITAGDTLEYVVTVTNTGNVTLTNVVVSDIQLTPNSATCTAVAPSATCVLTGDHVVSQTEANAGTLANTASVTSTEISGPTPSNTVNTSVNQDPALTNVKADPTLKTDADGSTDITAGDTLEYVVTVTNTGNVTLNNVVVTDSQLTPGFETCAAVLPGATCVLTGDHIVSQVEANTGIIANTASVTSTEVAGPTPSNTVNTSVNQDPALTNVKANPTLKTDADGSADITSGDTLEYVVTVTNSGNITLNNVVVTDSQLTPNSTTCAAVAPGATCVLTGDHLVSQTEANAGTLTNTASVTSTEVAGPTPSNTVNTTVNQDPALTNVKADPTLKTDADGSTDITAGDTLEYVVTVTNTGNVTLNNVVVTDAQLTPSSESCASLAPGATCVLTGDHVVSQTEANAGTLSNTASVTSTEVAGPTPSNTVNTGVEGDPELTMVKTAVDTNFAALNDIINYTYFVENVGNVAVSSLVVTDDKIAVVDCPVTTLAPGANTTCTATYSVNQADLDAGLVTNNAEANATPSNGILSTAGAMATVNGTQAPSLTIAKTAIESTYANVSDVLNYQYVVTNNGNVTITNPISVDDDKIVTPAVVSCPSLPMGGLVPTESITCSASYVVTQADIDSGSITNIATATDGTTTSPIDTVTVDATQTPLISMIKTAIDTSYAAVDEVLSYEYSVSNDGNVLVADLAVTDDLISTVSCIVTAVGNGDTNLDPGETVVCTASYTVTQADLDAGSVTNNAEATGTPSGGTLAPATAIETVDATQTPTLVMTKTALDTDYASVGEVLNYEYSVENTGNVYVSDLTVSDDKISVVTCDVTLVGNNDVNLDPGETVVCTASYSVDQADIDTGSVTNIAEATGTPSGGTLTNASATETVTGTQSPALSVVKNVTDEQFTLPGDITTYEYIVTNAGNTTITDPIVVSDNRISNVDCPVLPAGGLAPNATITCTGEYTVSQTDLDTGSVTNLASAIAGATASPQTSATIPANQSPALTIAKSGLFADFTTAGEVVEYEYTVTNSGNLTLTSGVTIEDDKIGTISCISGNFVPNSVQTCTANYTITQADVDAGFVTNQAYGVSGSIVSPPVDVTVNAVQSPSVDFVKRAMSTDFDSKDDVLSYEFDVVNTGNVTLSSINVSDDLTSVSCPSTSLAPSTSMICTAGYTVTQADVDSGDVVNNANVSATPPGSAAITETSSVTISSVATSGLSFEKTALDTSFANEGDILDYEFKVENTGNITLSNISVTDDLTSVSCPLTSLAPSQAMTCTASYTVSQMDVDAGSVTNNASISSQLPNGNAGPAGVDSAVVDGSASPELTLVKTAVDTSYASVNDVLSYTYVVTNTGNVTVNSISVTDDLIPSLLCPSSSLAPAGSMTCTADYTITQSDIDSGSVTNTATATGSPTQGMLVAPIDVATVNANQVPSLSMVKTAVTSDYSAPGDILSYEYDVTNTGNVTMTGSIAVSDDKIASVICPSLPMTGLAPNASVTCMADYVVSQADIDAGSVTNIASAANGTTISPTAIATVTATQTPALTVVKNSTTATFSMPNDTVSYTYEVINSGNTTITDPVVISDDKIASVSCPALPAGGLAPMQSLTCSADYTVVQADIDAGAVTNIASATSGSTVSSQVSRTVVASQSPSASVVKTATNVNFTSPGDLVTYEYVVTNDGNTTFTNQITITDNRIASVSCPALPTGGILPGDSQTCTATYVVTQDDLDQGSVTNIATATTGATISPPVSATIPAGAMPALVITKSSTDTSYASVGDILTYSYELENTGNVTLTGDTEIVDNKIGTFVCFTGNIIPGATETCSATYAVTQEDIDLGYVTNDAYGDHPRATSAPVAVTITATQTPELSMVKTALTSNFGSVGDVLSYEFAITNTGNTTIIFPVTVNDSRIPDVSCPDLPVGGLVPGGAIVCTGTDTASQLDIDAGQIENTADATDGVTTSAVETATVSGTQTPSLNMVKTALSSNFASVGDTLDYSYVVTNSGNVTVIDPVTIDDSRIGTIVCPALPSGGLVPGAAITCTATDTVSQVDLDSGSVENTATASSLAITSPSQSVTVTGTQTPELSINKTATTTDYTNAGDIIAYTYEVTNVGNITILDAVTVSDDKIASVTCPALPSGDLAPGASLTCSADYEVSQTDVDNGFVTNIASATAGSITSPVGTETVNGTQAPALSVEKSSLTSTFAMPGDVLSYEYVVTNNGNITIENAISISDDKIASVSCPALPSDGLAPNGSITCSADYIVTQADVDAGSVTNIATASSGTLISPVDTVTVDATTNAALAVSKTVNSSVQVAGPIFDVSYNLVLENTGNVTLTDVQLEDDLMAALAPSVMLRTPTVSVSGIAGAVANTAYDGVTNLETLSGTPVLNVGESGTVTINVRLDITNGGPANPNTAYGNASELSEKVPSNDPTITPTNPVDTNPTPLEIVDTDKDGSPDNFESGTEDRDGDGIPDREDYDPTGYFYCEENGRILTGGGISVAGPAGSNAAIGSLNNITIVQDGSDGYFQFYVSEPGRYTLTPNYPVTGAPSDSRIVSPRVLDVTSLLPENPAALGSSEFGSTGALADFSAAANNPFYFQFDIEAGDPTVFMNNIPMQHCGNSELALAKSVVGDPVTQEDGSQLVTYEFNVTNSGETQVDNVQITDDLGDVYGDANVVISQNEITAEPSTFAGQENAGYDGVVDTNILDGLGSLESGETLTVQIQSLVTPEIASVFINKANVQGSNPLTGASVDADDTASLQLVPAAKVSDLVVRKTARPRTVQIGDPVLYTIEVNNAGIGNVTNIDIVDNIPAGFAYIPNSATLTDGSTSVAIEPLVTGPSNLSWSLSAMTPAPLDYLSPGETISVNLRLLAGPNVAFGAHENQAYASNPDTGTRSAIATATVDYIPEPTFDCTPVLGRVYDDVNHNGYPDDGEPGLPSVRLVTVNGDIVTTDQYGRYHIPCAAIADSEHGSNFLLKADVRTLPLGFTPTTENPRVVRATRGKFVKLNFGAAFRPKLRVDLFASDFDRGLMTPEAASRINSVFSVNQTSERAIVVYHAAESEDVHDAQGHLTTALKVIEELAPKSMKDVAMEASWGEAKTRENGDGENFAAKTSGQDSTDRIGFTSDERGGLKSTGVIKSALRGERGSKSLEDDESENSISLAGRQDAAAATSARPGRLQRWVSWSETMSPYVDGTEIETTVDSLDPVKRLNAQANVVADGVGRFVMVEAYHNYAAFTTKLEIRLFDADRSARGEPIVVFPVEVGSAAYPVNNAWPEDISYVLRAYSAKGDFDETAPKTLIIGDPEQDLTPEDWSNEAYTAFGQNTLVKNNITVRGGAVRIYGRNVAGKTVTVMNQEVRIDEKGQFVSEQLLPGGQQEVEIQLPGKNASTNRIVRMVDVKSREAFYVAQAEATIGSRPSDSDTFTEGRLAFYVRSRLNDRWAFTATADTGEAEIEDLLKGLDDKDVTQLLRRLDPDKYYPVYGDDSTIEQDAPTSGRIYARIEHDDDYLLWGNYQTNFSDTEFARIQRTLYGAKFHWDEEASTKYGDARTAVTGFLAEGGTRQGRDELRGTGGSVYYFRHGDISIGSEILRVETRDAISGLVIESRRLTYGTDYDMDFIQGRVILNRPLSSSSNDGRLFRDGNNSGNEEILVADYEYSPVIGSDDDATIYGARASRWIGDLAKFGVTYNHGDDGGVKSDLLEADLTLQFAAGSYIKGEIAQSKGRGVETFRSIDGGFTYNPRDRGGLISNNESMAYAIEAATDLKDFFDTDGRIHAYWRKREAGFAGYAESTNQDIEQYGGGIKLDLFEDLSLMARADIIDDQTVGTNSFAEASAEYKVSENVKLSAGASFNDDGRGNEGTSIGARAEYALNEDTNVYVFGQANVDGDNRRTSDRAGVGGEFRLGKHVFGGAEISGGEDGLGARVSARYQQEDGDEYYMAYDLPLQSQVASNYGTFNLGARERFSDALSVYGEERMQFNERGLNGITHAYGVDYKPGNWNFGLSGETGRIDDLDRDAVSASVGFGDERMQAGITSEYRQDQNILSGEKRRTFLLRSTALYQVSDELRVQAKLNMAQSDQASDLVPNDFNEAEFIEASFAAAYRPIWDDRLNVLAKMTYLYDLSPTSQRFNGEMVDYRQKSNVYSVDASYDVAARWTLGGKYAHRSGFVTDGRESDAFYKSSADLGVIRADYHLSKKWDATFEGRYLTIGDGVVDRKGGLAMLYRHINDNAKIGAGLSYGGIDQEYLLAQDDDDIGWLINVVGKF